MGKQAIDNIFVIARMKLSVALFAAAAAWDQPAWKDVQAALNDEGGRADFDWGHPIDDSSKKWYHCPTINETAIANLDSIKCKKSTCALKCLPGLVLSFVILAEFRHIDRFLSILKYLIFKINLFQIAI